MRHKTPALFVFTLFTLLKIEEYVACKGEIKQVLDALASIVCAYDALKKTVMDLIQYYEGQCDFKLANFVNYLCTGQENAHHEFPVSMAYLRFINKVYKCELPQMLLERENLIEVNRSCLEDMLTLVYVPLVKEFRNIQFNSVGHFAKMARRLMKITGTLLSKLNPGPCATATIGIK
jgi:exosortase/archaeosortase